MYIYINIPCIADYGIVDILNASPASAWDPSIYISVFTWHTCTYINIPCIADYGIVDILVASPASAWDPSVYIYLYPHDTHVHMSTYLASQITASSTFLMPRLQVPEMLVYIYICIHMYICQHSLHRRLRHRRWSWCFAQGGRV